MILITGGTGILGKELIKLFPDSIYPTHKKLELSDKDRVLKFMQDNTIDVIIHAVKKYNSSLIFISLDN